MECDFFKQQKTSVQIVQLNQKLFRWKKSCEGTSRKKHFFSSHDNLTNND